VDKDFLTHEDAWRNKEIYKEIYDYSIKNIDEYWMAQIDRLSWTKEPTVCFERTETEGYLQTSWFPDGKINACYNCVDRHSAKVPNKTAIIWQGEEEDCYELITYKKLKDEVCKFANTLKKFGITKNDFVTIYLPMVPEAAYACLACARLGIPYSVVFAGFSPTSVALRMQDCSSSFVITCDSGVRKGKLIPLKKNVDEVRELCEREIKALIVRRKGSDIEWKSGLDFDYYDLSSSESNECEISDTNSLSPLFALYTSGSTEKPKGVLQGTGGFLLFSSMTHKYFFSIDENSVFWCSGDIGWMGGHAYSLFAPLCNGVTSLFFEGTPNYPSLSAFSDVIEKYKVTSFNTAPTVLRAMMKNSDETLGTSSRSTLRNLGVFGETISKDVCSWYFNEFGNGVCPIVNMWGQTELGGVPTAPLTNLEEMSSFGHAGRPFFGCEFVVKDEDGVDVTSPNEVGGLYMKNPMPGMMIGILGDKDAVKRIYYPKFKDLYFTGDEAFFDQHGYLWITGRIDDVLNVSGHRVSAIEIESIVMKEDFVSEVSVVGFPHPIKGEGICVFAVLKEGCGSEFDKKNAEDTIVERVRIEASSICQPDKIIFIDDLPKTRSGKIMRRILKNLIAGEQEKMGDVSTLANPECIDEIRMVLVAS
jgi:acetyl-CoA synthetase